MNKNPDNNFGWTPLHYAAMYGHFQICLNILRAVKDRNPMNNSGETPLHFAASNGHLDIYKLIMEKVMDINPKDNFGWTPLHHAAKNGHFQIYKLIIMSDHDEKFPMTDCGLTPTQLAEQYGNFNISRFLF